MVTASPGVGGTPAAPSRRLQRVVLAALVLVVLAAGLSPMPLPLAFPWQDKLLHLCGFAALVLSARLAFPRLHPGTLALGSLALALSIELAQSLMDSRSASLTDMAANLLGVGLGLACASWMLRGRPD